MDQGIKRSPRKRHPSCYEPPSLPVKKSNPAEHDKNLVSSSDYNRSMNIKIDNSCESFNPTPKSGLTNSSFSEQESPELEPREISFGSKNSPPNCHVSEPNIPRTFPNKQIISPTTRFGSSDLPEVAREKLHQNTMQTREELSVPGKTKIPSDETIEVSTLKTYSGDTEATESSQFLPSETSQNSRKECPKFCAKLSGTYAFAKTVKELWIQFGNNTSMHGVGRMNGSFYTWKKILWGLLVIASTVMAVRSLYLTILDYSHYPVSTSVGMVNQRSLDFPAITICNLNPFRMSKLDPRLQAKIMASKERGDSEIRQEKIFRLNFHSIYGIHSDGHPAHHYHHHHHNSANTTTTSHTHDSNVPAYQINHDDFFYTDRHDIKHTIEEMLVDGTYDGVPVIAEDFVRTDNLKYGSCYCYNVREDPNQLLKSYRAGSHNGLILELDIQQLDYLPFTHSAGLKVAIHSPKVTAFPEENGILVRPGVSTSIGLTMLTLKREIPPWGPCVEPEEVADLHLNMFQDKYTGYSQETCHKTCYQKSVQKLCSCCDPSYPCVTTSEDEDEPQNPRNATHAVELCDESNITTFVCMDVLRGRYHSGHLPCIAQCRPSCHETIYKMTYATASWPSLRFQDSFRDKVSKASKMRGEFVEPKNITEEYLQQNFVRLEVFYRTLQEEVVTEARSYNWNKLLSDIGGHLGLWLGFSMLTALEFLELAWEIARVSRIRKQPIEEKIATPLGSDETGC